MANKIFTVVSCGMKNNLIFIGTHACKMKMPGTFF